MREIKFRAWDKRHNTMIGMEELADNWGFCIFYQYEYDYGLKVMQSTGLHDKNGVEIFEGDIVRAHHANYYDEEFGKEPEYNPWVGAVEYRPGSYLIVGRDAYTPMLSNITITSLEVMGNIHQHPSLL